MQLDLYDMMLMHCGMSEINIIFAKFIDINMPGLGS